MTDPTLLSQALTASEAARLEEELTAELANGSRWAWLLLGLFGGGLLGLLAGGL